MKNSLLILLIFVFKLTNPLISQINLVPNPSFDSVDCVFQQLKNWKSDGFAVSCHVCYPLGITPRPNLKIPYINPSPWGYSDTYQFPNSGGGFIGVEVSQGRGYFHARLNQELEQYKQYYASFRVVPYYPIYSWIKWPYNDAIGLVVTPFENAINGNSNSYFDERPVAESRGTYLRDTMNWKKVSSKFVARGQEQFVVIGNFRNNENTRTDLNGYIPGSKGPYASNMFFIDDVVVSKFDPLPDTAILCTNSTLVFDGTFYEADLTWSDFSKNPTLEVTKPGLYGLQAKIDGEYFNDQVVVIAEKEFQPLPKDTVVCQDGPSVILSANAKAQFRWSTGSSSNAITVNSAGKYTVTVTTPSCTLSFSTNVKERDCFCDFYAPNTFSPNGDGVNEGFKPFINCKIIYVKDYKLSIFNRLGNRVFTTTDINQEWDGLFDGKPCSEGVYAWVVEYNTLIDKDLPYRKVVESGDIAIVK